MNIVISFWLTTDPHCYKQNTFRVGSEHQTIEVICWTWWSYITTIISHYRLLIYIPTKYHSKSYKFFKLRYKGHCTSQWNQRLYMYIHIWWRGAYIWLCLLSKKTKFSVNKVLKGYLLSVKREFPNLA